MRGHVTYPFLSECSETQKINTKELRLEGCNYKINEEEILDWIQMYGVIQGEVEKEAIILNEGSDDKVTMGTGVYLVPARLDRLVPNLLPIQGKRIKVWYQGVKRQCNQCYGYHKTETLCLEKSFDEYMDEFKANNPNIPAELFKSENSKVPSDDCHNDSDSNDDNINNYKEEIEEQHSKEVEQGEQKRPLNHNCDEDRLAFRDSSLSPATTTTTTTTTTAAKTGLNVHSWMIVERKNKKKKEKLSVKNY